MLRARNWSKICILHILSNTRPKTNVNKVPGWVFRYVGNKVFDFSSKKRIFCPKTTQFGPKLAFFVHCRLIWCPVGGLAGGFGAGCISQDAYLLYYYAQIWRVYAFTRICCTSRIISIYVIYAENFVSRILLSGKFLLFVTLGPSASDARLYCIALYLLPQ